MLQIVDVSHAYEDLVSLRQVTLDVQPGEIVCLLGPSGCGKTTLLRLVAGLEKASEGSITFAGADISATPVHQREFGLMFQNFALFPHLNVAENIAYGLRRRGLTRQSAAKEAESWLERVGMAGLGERDITSLSGGQQQRVALARSLAPRPRLLMLDEPLGSLDAQLRDQLALELRQLIKRQGLGAIYVTHDHREAYAVADRIAVMNIGIVEQVDSPRDLYDRPRSAFVARFLGIRNVFDIERSEFVRQICTEAFHSGTESKSVLVHPAGIGLGQERTERALHFDAVFADAVFRGEYFDVSVIVYGETKLYFSIPTLHATIGETVTVTIARDAVIALDY